MTARCISEPISWPRLERLALGEAQDEAEIRIHLDACEACRASFAKIQADADVPLPAIAARPGRSTVSSARPAPWRRAVLATASAVALAAGVVLVMRRPGTIGKDDPGNDRVKGAPISFTLAREDNALFAEAGGVYRDGDRFKVLVSCAPGVRARFDLVVYDDDGASFPLQIPASFACGNDEPLPGAFRLKGAGTAQVCLVWGDDAPDRRELERTGYDPMRPFAACKVLQAAR